MLFMKEGGKTMPTTSISVDYLLYQKGSDTPIRHPGTYPVGVPLELEVKADFGSGIADVPCFSRGTPCRWPVGEGFPPDVAALVYSLLFNHSKGNAPPETVSIDGRTLPRNGEGIGRAIGNYRLGYFLIRPDGRTMFSPRGS